MGRAYSVGVGTSTLRVKNRAVVIDVSGIEKLEVLVTKLTVTSDEAFHVVELTESLGELDVGGIAQSSVTEEAEAILWTVSRVPSEQTRVQPSHLGTGTSNFLDGLVVEVVPVRDFDLSAEGGMHRLDCDLGESGINIENTCHGDGWGS